MLKEGRLEGPRWHSRLLCYLVTCLQEGMFAGSPFDEMLKKAKVMRPTPGEEGGSTVVETQEEAVLRKASKNALVIATLMLADPVNQNRQRCILSILEAVELWHGLQNRELRSTSATQAFLTKQILGEYWTPLVAACSKLHLTANFGVCRSAHGRGRMGHRRAGRSGDLAGRRARHSPRRSVLGDIGVPIAEVLVDALRLELPVADGVTAEAVPMPPSCSTPALGQGGHSASHSGAICK